MSFKGSFERALRAVVLRAVALRAVRKRKINNPGRRPGPGMVLREGYTAMRQGKRVHVPATWIKDVGKPGKTPKSERWAKIEPGALGGWSKDMSEKARREILRGIVQRESYASVVRRLNQLANLTTDARTKRTARADMKWLKQTYRSAT